MISSRACVRVGVACAVLGLAATASAKPPPHPDDDFDDLVIATDPVVVTPVEPPVVEAVMVAPPPEPIDEHGPYALPVAEPKRTPGESVIVLASGMGAWMSEPGGLERMGQGGTLSFTFVERKGDVPTGVEVTGVFLVGEDASLYALTSRLIASPKIGRRVAVPYLAVGLVAGASRLVTAEQKARDEVATYGWAIGPSAAVGLHGFVSDSLYWRAGAGFLGAGIGAFTADVGIGMVID